MNFEKNHRSLKMKLRTDRSKCRILQKRSLLYITLCVCVHTGDGNGQFENVERVGDGFRLLVARFGQKTVGSSGRELGGTFGIVVPPGSS